MAREDLETNRMMRHLLDALERGEDIGHYGRLVFAMVARHFLTTDELVAELARDRDFSEEDARALVMQVEERDYSPPRRERILDWQSQQEFPICPHADDPDEANVYRDLKFPDHVYAHIREYRHEKVQAQAHETVDARAEDDERSGAAPRDGLGDHA